MMGYLNCFSMEYHREVYMQCCLRTVAKDNAKAKDPS